jgi:hypothetical protein
MMILLSIVLSFAATSMVLLVLAISILMIMLYLIIENNKKHKYV